MADDFQVFVFGVDRIDQELVFIVLYRWHTDAIFVDGALTIHAYEEFSLI